MTIYMTNAGIAYMLKKSKKTGNEYRYYPKGPYLRMLLDSPGVKIIRT